MTKPVPRLQYLHSYSYVFEGDQGLITLVLLSVCNFIPIIGPIVVAGYQYEVVAALHRYPGQTYPAFDFNRFAEYLARGVWRFLANMIMWMFVAPVYFVVFYGGMGLIFLAGAIFTDSSNGQPDENAGLIIGIAATIVVPLGISILLAVVIAMRLIINPLVLKASLSGEAGDLFDFRFMTDFVRRTWRETILELLWIYVTTPIMMLLGICLCFIGVYPAHAWALMADAHTNWQLYEIYLARGGQPVQLREDRAVVAASVAAVR